MRRSIGLLTLLTFTLVGCTTCNHPTQWICRLCPAPVLPATPPPTALPAPPTRGNEPENKPTTQPTPPRAAVQASTELIPIEYVQTDNDADRLTNAAGLTPDGDDVPTPATVLADPLDLQSLLDNVDESFPLLLAIAEERRIAQGQRIAAEGAFDTNLRSRFSEQAGTFPSTRVDVLVDQPTPIWGVNVFGGYRFGQEDFPLYYGDRLTADGGEFRGGVAIPLLRDGPIDRRRASARQAEIARSLAEPVIQRARIDALRNAARAYWSWAAAAEQVYIAEDLLRIARQRQRGLETQFAKGQISEFLVYDNRRAVVEREGALAAAERRFQQTALELSLFYRNENGDPIVLHAGRAPIGLLSQTLLDLDASALSVNVEFALQRRPELRRFELQKARVAVDQRLAANQTLPNLSAAVSGSQDVGKGKKGTGTSALDREVLEAAVLFDVPLQRRDAKGKLIAAQAQMNQLLQQERYARDQIFVEVQDAVSNLDRTRIRIEKARQEQEIAERVADMERERFTRGQSSLFEVNLRELSAAGARAKVIDALADYQRARADLRAATADDVQ